MRSNISRNWEEHFKCHPDSFSLFSSSLPRPHPVGPLSHIWIWLIAQELFKMHHFHHYYKGNLWLFCCCSVEGAILFFITYKIQCLNIPLKIFSNEKNQHAPENSSKPFLLCLSVLAEHKFSTLCLFPPPPPTPQRIFLLCLFSN